MDSSSGEEVLHDFLPFIRVYKNGRVERYILTGTTPPGFDPATDTESKDIAISEEPNIKARIFRPKVSTKNPNKLPLFVHFHGGGFCAGSAFGPITKFTLGRFASYSNVMAISIDYRLPPEHPLPIAHEDSWAAVQWIATHANGTGPEPWLNDHVDYDKVFLAGESAGANIAHDVAIQASVNPLRGVNIVGLAVIHPYFVTDEPDEMLKFLYPTSGGSKDNPRLNPGVDPRLAKLRCKKVLVCVAEKDPLIDRGVDYHKSLINSGWGGDVEFIETKGEDHCFHLFTPTSEAAKSFFCKLASFVNESK